MLKQLYKGVISALFLAVVAACSTEQFTDGELVPSDTPIQLSGALTRAVGDGLLITTGNPLADRYGTSSGVKFYLSARTATDNNVYFSNMPMTIGNNESDGRNDLNSSVYYPLGGTEINLYAHTGTQATGTPANTITLTSGTALSNDILFGRGTNVTGNTIISGKSDDPIKYITFKHLMTQVAVDIDVIDATDDPTTGGVQPTLPTNIQIKFKNSAVVTGGTYGMLSGTVSPNSTDYTLNVGTHYLVPTGKTISGTGSISSLVIDDYTATSADLATLTVPQAEKSGTYTDLVLSPGLSYTLTFQIKRLKVVGIKLTLNDWTPKSGSGTWGYEAYPVSLNFESESGTTGYDEKKITKMVLKHTTGGNTYQYIGEADNGTINFVTLPSVLLSSDPASGLTADLYTQDELLIKDIDVSKSAASNLKIILGENGLTQNTDATDTYYEITTPLQFALFMNSASTAKNGTYRIMNDIDMDHTSVAIIPTEFPSTATLDGGTTWNAGTSSYEVHKILHLNLSGNGLVTENKGTLRNIYIASGTITAISGTSTGSICATNNGTISGCVNQANIVATASQTAGGICGVNGSTGKILACLNTGNITNATTVGGICGTNENTTTGVVTACLNTGFLNKGATNLGGICGKYEGAPGVIINTCYWLTGTARKDQAISEEFAIGNKNATTISGLTSDAADLAAQTIRSMAIYMDMLTAKLTADGSKWKFILDENKSSWPIPVPAP